MESKIIAFGGLLRKVATVTQNRDLFFSGGVWTESGTLGAELDTGFNGRLLPTTGIDEYYADLLLWLGVPKSDLPQALPNIVNFYDINSASPPLGLSA